ncbi:unnamed protein product, partial [Effrenium voratum]
GAMPAAVKNTFALLAGESDDEQDQTHEEQVPVEEEYPQAVEEPVVETKGKKGKKKGAAVAEPQAAAPVAAVAEVREAPKKKEPKEPKEPKAKQPAALGKNKFAMLLGDEEDSDASD